MSRRAPRVLATLLAAIVAVAACTALFAAWLQPRNVAAWLGGWAGALCG